MTTWPRRPRGSPKAGPVDILLTHGCPIGLADLTPTGRHGGQRCFLEAYKTIMPRLHLCGHLHVAQERTLKDGRQGDQRRRHARGLDRRRRVRAERRNAFERTPGASCRRG